MTNLNPDNKCSDLYKEFDLPKDPFKDMYERQMELQIYMASKDKARDPRNKTNYQAAVRYSIYMWNNVIVEWMELLERVDANRGLKSLKGNELLEVKFELIDMWFFVMNSFIYLSCKDISAPFAEMFDEAKKKNERDIKTSGIDRQMAFDIHFQSMMFAWARLCNDLPYKDWKNYIDFKADNKLFDSLKPKISSIMVLLINLAVDLEITPEEFYNLYRSKEEENRNRQERGY